MFTMEWYFTLKEHVGRHVFTYGVVFLIFGFALFGVSMFNEMVYDPTYVVCSWVGGFVLSVLGWLSILRYLKLL